MTPVNRFNQNLGLQPWLQRLERQSFRTYALHNMAASRRMVALFGSMERGIYVYISMGQTAKRGYDIT